MPAQHNHNDRGALHEDCGACIVVAKMMTDAGVSPAQVFDYSASPEGLGGRYTPPGLIQLRDRITHPSATDDQADSHGFIHGQEMGNKASIDADRSYNDEIDWLTDLLYKIEAQSIGYGQAALHSHLYRDHDLLRAPLDIRLRPLQEIHAGSHLLHQGHGGDPEHMISRIDREALRGRKRLLEQKRWSALNTGLRAEQHRRREQRARESREAVMVESARALRRAIEHTKGTVLPRVNYDESASAQVQIQVGIKDRVTIAAASIGHDVAVGTAICHPTDRFDPEVGRQLAVARALVALGSVHELEWMTKVEERNR